MNTESDIKKQLEFIGVGLDAALEHGLELEVIYFALKYMRENPNVTPAEAFALGITEWIK
jgi:hypothetical protein